MMTHLDEGQLRALLDDEMDGTEDTVRTHLDGCQECSDLLAAIDSRRGATRSAIAVLDVPPPMAEARDAVNARLGSTASDTGQGSGRPAYASTSFRFVLRRAAVILLLLTGLTAALPGSALRAWMVSGWRAAVELLGAPEAPPLSAPSESAAAVQESGAAGVQFEIADGPLQIVLTQIESGSLVVVRFVDGTRAAFSGVDARFRRTADGRFEVTGGSGTIRIDVPYAVSGASLSVNDRIYLTMDGDAVDLRGPVEAQAPEEISFRVR